MLNEKLPRLADCYHPGVGVHSGVHMSQTLKAPFPWFGGKRAVASLIWSRLGNVDNYVEPFAGSCAVLLLRPHLPRIETLNDADHYVANFWRATQQNYEAVVSYADGPVNEVDLHSRHRWLVLSDHAKEFRERMRTDPDYCDPKVAGWWCWGLCCWIGGGWCSVPDLRADGTPKEKRPQPDTHRGHQGVHSGPCGEQRRPVIANPGSEHGHGVHGTPEVPADPASKVRIAAHNPGSYGKGVHAKGDVDVSNQRPQIRGGGHDGPYYGQGVHTKGPTGEFRPQLADYALGRGVHAGPAGGQIPLLRGQYGLTGAGVNMQPGAGSGPPAGTCEQRRQWLLDWFGRLRDRLRNVRVCCGDWTRVCSSESVTTRLGLTGVFLDPPYGTLAKRAKGLYAQDSLTVAEQVRHWCLERGPDPQMRIALCGYVGEGHEILEQHGWECVAWEAGGGYGNRTEKGKANARKERIWFSPACVREPTLFDHLDVESDHEKPRDQGP
jgi:hypothetical protein